MKLPVLVRYLDRLLRRKDLKDASQNGLQVAGAAEVRRVAFAVDACQAASDRAVALGAQLLIVHHGLFWEKPLVATGPHGRRLRALLKAEVSLYASHLPLDAHPRLGNNAELARGLGLAKCFPWGEYHGGPIGIGGQLPRPLPLAFLVERLARCTGSRPIGVLAHGPKLVRRVGCISGAAASMLEAAQREGFDTYVTGETSHSLYHEAAERQMNVLFGGHYATETLGVKALARHLHSRFGLQTEFIDLPTGW